MVASLPAVALGFAAVAVILAVPACGQSVGTATPSVSFQADVRATPVDEVARQWSIAAYGQEAGVGRVADVPASESESSARPLTLHLPSSDAGKIPECEITFLEYRPGPGRPGAPTSTDMSAISSAMSLAVSQSRTMRKNLREACSRTSSSIFVRVKRGDPKQLISQAVRADVIEIDLADIEMAGRFMAGAPTEADMLAESFVYAVLAHEIVHLRDGLQAHAHRLGQDMNISCPAVEDETSVLSELGFHVRRENYAYLVNGRLKADYAVDGRRVVLNISDLADASK